MSVPDLRGERVLLRAPAARDIEAFRAAGRHPEVVLGYGERLPAWAPFTEEDARVRVEHLAATTWGWIIEADGDAVGHVALHSVRQDAAFVALGLLRDDLLGRGLGTDALRTLLMWAAGPPLALARMQLRVGEHNARAMAAYTKCGFVVTGREDRAFELDGAWLADLVMTAEL